MPIAKIQAPNGRIITLEVPQGATNEQIMSFLQQNPPEVPQAELDARPQLQMSEPGIGEQIAGGLENVASFATSILAEPIAGIAGGLAALNPFAEEGAGARTVEAVRGALTTTPQTQAGQTQQQAIGETLAPVGKALQAGEEFLGTKTLEATGSPVLATAAHSLPTLTLELLGLKGFKSVKGRRLSKTKSNRQLEDLLRNNLPDERIVGKQLIEDVTRGTSKIVRDKALTKIANQAEKQGITLGTLANVQAANKATKREMRKMIDLANTGVTNENFRRANRVSKVVGDAFKKRYDHVVRVHKKASRDIGRIVDKELKGVSIDASDAIDGFKKELIDRTGVTFNGNVPDFSQSSLTRSPASQGIINDIMQRTRNIASMDGKQLHDLKRTIRTFIKQGKKIEGGIDDIDPMLQRVTGRINEKLRIQSPRYGKANDLFRETLNATEPLEKIAGKSVDLSLPDAGETIGRILKKEMSNVQSREILKEARKSLEDISSRTGAKFADDLEQLNNFAISLENLFKGQAPTSFKGSIQDVADFATSSTIGKAQILGDKLLKTTKSEKEAAKLLKQFINKGK